MSAGVLADPNDFWEQFYRQYGIESPTQAWQQLGDTFWQRFENYYGVPVTQHAWAQINALNAASRASRLAVMRDGWAKATQAIRSLPDAAKATFERAKATAAQELARAGEAWRSLPTTQEVAASARQGVVDSVNAMPTTRDVARASARAGQTAGRAASEAASRAGAAVREAAVGAKQGVVEAVRALPTPRDVAAATARAGKEAGRAVREVAVGAKQGAVEAASAAKQGVVEVASAAKQGAVEGWNVVPTAGDVSRSIARGTVEAGRAVKQGAVEGWNAVPTAGDVSRSIARGTVEAGRAAKQGVVEGWNAVPTAGDVSRATARSTLDAYNATARGSRAALDATREGWRSIPELQVRRAQYWGGMRRGLTDSLSGKHIAANLGFETFRAPVAGPLPEGAETFEAHAPIGRGPLSFANPEAEGFFGKFVAPRVPLLLASGLQLLQLGIMGTGLKEWQSSQDDYCKMIASNEALTQSFKVIALQAQGDAQQAGILTKQIQALQDQAQAWQHQLTLKRRQFIVSASQTILLNIVLCLMLAFYLFGKRSKAAEAVARGDAAVAQLVKGDPLLAQVAAATVAGR